MGDDDHHDHLISNGNHDYEMFQQAAPENHPVFIIIIFLIISIILNKSSRGSYGVSGAKTDPMPPHRHHHRCRYSLDSDIEKMITRM